MSKRGLTLRSSGRVRDKVPSQNRGSRAAQLNRQAAMERMHISPHLCFDGQCREAIQLYATLLGGEIKTMLTYGETPMGSSLDSKSRERIVHATLMLEHQELTG